MTLWAPEHPSCFGVLQSHLFSTRPWYPGSSLSCATVLCALVYFSAQGGAHKTVPSSFLDPLVPIRLVITSMALAS